MTPRPDFEALPTGTLIVRDRRIVYASVAAAAMVGRQPRDVLGVPFTEFIAPEERERVTARHERRLRGEPVPAEYELQLLLPDGGRRVVECRVTVDGGDVVMAVRDLTAQAAVRPRLAGLAQLGADIQHERTEETILERVREGLWGLGLASLLIRPEEEAVRVVWARLPDGVNRGFLGRPLEGLRGPWTEFSRSAWREGAAFSDDWALHLAGVVPPAAADAARELATRAGLTRAAAVRIEERTAPRFYLVFAGEWLRQGDLPAMRLFGAQVAAALDAARTIADLSRHNSELAALDQLGRLAGETRDLATFLGRAAEVVAKMVGADGVTVFAADEEAGVLLRIYDRVAPPHLDPRCSRVPLDSALGQVARARTSRIARLDDHPPEARAFLESHGFRTFAWVALAAHSKVVGVMSVAWRRDLAEAECRIDLLHAMGAHFAAAMESYELLGDLRRRVSELTLLNDVALASATLDPVLLLENALRRICDTFEADTAGAFLRDGDRLTRVATVGISEETVRNLTHVPIGLGMPGLTIQRLAPIVTADMGELGGKSAEFQVREGIGPAVSVPLLSKNQALGVLLLGRRSARPFAEGDVNLLSAVGVQLGVAVENARLFADVRRRLADLESVHALALRIFGNAPGDVRALLEDGCREAARALSARGAAIFLVSEEGRTLRGAAAHGPPLRANELVIPLDRDGLASEALRTRTPVWCADVSTDPRSAMYGNQRVPPMSLLAVPLTARDATRGVLYLSDAPGRRFTAPEQALANALAGELAVGIENAELYAEARRRVEELSLLNEVGRTIAGSLDLDRILSGAVEALRRLLDASHAFVVLYDPQRAELEVAAGAGGDPASWRDSRTIFSGRNLCRRVLHEGRAVVVDDADSDPDLTPDYRARFGVRSLVAAPMLLRGEPVGAVVVDECRRARRFTEAEVGQVTALANQLAVAIENARLFQEARDRLAELTTVIDVARVVSSTLELDRVLEAGADHLARTLQAPGCTILLADFRANVLRRAAARGPPIERSAIPLDAPSIARAALEGRGPLTGPCAPSAECPCQGVLLALPLHARGEPVGVALVTDPHADRLFTQAEISRAMAIASQLAVAVDNARLYSETRRRAEELGLLLEVGRSLVATLELKEVLDAGVRNLARIVDAPVAYLALVDETGRRLEIRAEAGSRTEGAGHYPLHPPGAHLATAVFDLREPIVIEDALSDPRVSAGLEVLPRSGAHLGLPLLVRERAIGSAVIVDPRGPRRYTPAEVERAAAIANQLAVAVENARLYEDLRRSYAELNHAQQQLIQQERLAALGELSAVVAHEVRNPLGVIFNSLGSLRRLLRPTGDAKMLLDIVGEEADRLNRIVGDLLDFARPAIPVLRPERLERVVEEAVQAALAQNPVTIAVERDLPADLPPVPMDARMVRQAVLNVVVNAVQAMPRGGRLKVRVAPDDGSVLLDVEDSGAGIPDEVRKRIFEPFFTTKASGTGLGLAVVKRIVDGHAGRITVRSQPGVGTVFSLRFPLSHPAAPSEGSGAVPVEMGPIIG